MTDTSTTLRGLTRRSLSVPVRALPPRSRPRHIFIEFLVVLAGVLAYFGTRGVTEANPARAIENAQRIVALEQMLGMFHERTLQEWVLPHDLVVQLLNWVYIWGHWPVIGLVLLWLVRKHPPQYFQLRNALVISGVIGLVIFAVFPVAPPRLAGLGFVDSVAARSQAYRVLQPPAFVNQYAAVPSLHVGWDMLVGLFLVQHARHLLVRAIGVLLPLAMLASVVLTANHFIIDGVFGAAVALFGLYAARRLAGRTTDVRGAGSDPPRLPEQRRTCDP